MASAGDTRVGTPFAIEREVESYDLTIRAIDRSGAPTPSFFGDLHAPVESVPFGGQEATVIRLPRGEYPLGAFVIEADGFTASLLGAARHPVTRDSVLTLDARTARRVEVVPPRDSAGLPIGAVAATGVTDTYAFAIGVLSHGGYDGVFTVHSGSTGDPDRFAGYVFGDWAEPGPGGDFANSPYVYHLTWFSPGRGYGLRS